MVVVQRLRVQTGPPGFMPPLVPAAGSGAGPGAAHQRSRRGALTEYHPVRHGRPLRLQRRVGRRSYREGGERTANAQPRRV